jgi:hypothetical protein
MEEISRICRAIVKVISLWGAGASILDSLSHGTSDLIKLRHLFLQSVLEVSLRLVQQL